MNPLVQLTEAALFSAARPLTIEELQTLDPDASLADVRQALDQLRELYDFNQHSVDSRERIRVKVDAEVNWEGGPAARRGRTGQPARLP